MVRGRYALKRWHRYCSNYGQGLRVWHIGTPGAIVGIMEREQQRDATCTILLVEDEEKIREMLYVVLEQMGHRVLEAQDGASGLQVSRNFHGRIDLVISDVIMPKMDGPEMIRHLQRERPGIKALLISGYSATNVPLDLMEHFLPKPFSPVQIRVKVDAILGSEPCGTSPSPSQGTAAQ